MTKLIALVDGSIYSRSVCDHAAWIAERTGLALEILHIIGRRQTSNAPADLSGSIALGARSALLKELSEMDEMNAKLAQKRGRAILEDARTRIEAVWPGSGAGEIATKLRIGDIVETVAELGVDAEIVTIGKRGEAADFAKLHLGSNLERIARTCQSPLFVASRAFRPVERVLIACDGGASSRKAVDYVARSPLFAGLHCRVLTVGADSAAARRTIGDAETVLRAAGRAVESGIADGQPETVIPQAIKTGGIDLLVMGAYGHSRVRALVLGSTTTEMMRLCKVPVMLFR